MDLLDRLHAGLTPEFERALEAAVSLASEGGSSLFLVGGAVRDLLLGRPNIDLDLVTEQDHHGLAAAIAERLGARPIFHDRFATATIRGPRLHLDLARARRETYQRPGALPAVVPASLTEDLARRDFTINAVALRLTAPPGELSDPFQGARDIDEGRIRVLHEKSFQDDATRVLRALRYGSRLSFRLDPVTASILVRDLAYVATISGSRLRRELTLTLQEERCVDACEQAADLGVLAAIHPRLGLGPALAQQWRAALLGPRHGDRDILGWCVIADCPDVAAVRALAERLHLTARIEAALRDAVRLSDLSDKLIAPETGPADAAELLDRYLPEAVWAGAVRGGEAARVYSSYLERWRKTRPALTGEDLVAAGVAPGPVIGAALRLLRRARLESRVHDRDGEIALLRGEMDLRL